MKIKKRCYWYFHSLQVCYKVVTAPERPQIITDTSQIPAEDEKEGCPRCGGKVHNTFLQLRIFYFHLFCRYLKLRKCRPRVDFTIENVSLVAIVNVPWIINFVPKARTATFTVSFAIHTCLDIKPSPI